METGRGGGSGYADYTWATKIVYIEAWFNTLWRLRTENLWNFTLEMSLRGALGFQWLPSRSNIIHINRWKLESDIIPSSAARKNVLVAFMKNEAEARAWYPQRWKVHPSMKIMRFWWGCLKWLQEFSPLTASFENKQLDVVISIIMLFTSQRKRKAKCACMNSWQLKTSVFPDSDKAMAWWELRRACIVFVQAAAQLSAVDHVILKFRTAESKFKVHSIPCKYSLIEGGWLFAEQKLVLNGKLIIRTGMKN